MSKKKILFTSHTANFQKFNRPFMRMLREQGWEVHYASMGEEKILDTDKEFVVPFTRSPFKLSNVTAYKQLKEIIDREGYDLIHTHTPMGSVVTRLAARDARKKGTRVIYTAHGFHFFKGAPFVYWLVYYTVERYMAHHTDVLVTINDEDYRLAKRYFKTVTRYIPGVGVDLSRFKAKIPKSEISELRKSLGLQDSDFVIIYVAELLKRKNQPWLIKAVDKLLKDNPSMHLLLAGADSLDGRVQSLVEELGLQRQVHIVGYRNDVPKLMKASNLAISTSVQEGLGLHLVEAMASGLPVIATDNRGHRDAVMGVARAQLFPLGDSELFCRAIEEVYKVSPAEYMASLKSADQDVYDRFSLNKVLSLVQDIYDDRVPSVSISVVIPMYNSQSTITRVLDSIYNQTPFGMSCIKEVIVVDDGSRDDSLKTVRSYKKQHRLGSLRVIARDNSGPSAARNIGIRSAIGDWVAFLDSDDSWAHDKIEQQVGVIGRNPDTNIIVTASNLVSSTQGRWVEPDVSYFTVFSYLLQSRVVTSSVLVKKASLEAAGCFDESMKYAEDQNLFMRIIANGGIFYINKPLVKWADKAVFGDTGLSSKLKLMHEGVNRNTAIARREGIIGLVSYFVLLMAEYCKYMRRVFITYIRRGNR